MLHPVGSLPPSVYWRRRLALIASLVALIAISAWVLHSGSGGKSPQTRAQQSSTTHPSTTAAVAPRVTSSVPTTPAPTTTTPSPAGSSTSAKATAQSGVTVPVACTVSQLTLAAQANQPTYHVGDEPQLMLKVTNPGSAPCVQDLSDSHVELRVYNGESRVWGSHDCKIDPAQVSRTLAAHGSVTVSIIWSGLSSQPNCAGTRQRVGAGSYTLYALLDGRMGQAAQFSMS